MVKKRRGRSVKNNTNAQGEPEELITAPHSFVIHKGLPGGNILELTKDFRKVMEPFTAAALRERKQNTIKDFVHIAGLFHVSHLCVFSRTDLGVYMKLGRMARGPTLTFKVHDFCLSRDVISSLRKQMVVEQSFKHSPLIILNGFSGEGMQFKLMASMFQNMFPSINLTKVDLNTVRRCVLLNYNATTKRIDFRHFNIKVAPVGISKGVKKIVQGKVPNLAKFENISDFLEKAGMLSESEAEDDPNSHVTLPQKIISRGNVEAGKSGIRLSELGPRLSLQLMKIEDGLLDGEVLYHDVFQKTEEEKLEIQKRLQTKKKLKEKRKRIQEQNTKQKENEKSELKEKSLKGMKKPQLETDKLLFKSSKEANREAQHEDDDDAQYYRDEVGEEPDKELFSSRPFGMKRPANSFHTFKSKRPRMDENSGGKDRRFEDKKPGFRDKGRKPGFGDKFNDRKPGSNKFNDRKPGNSKFNDRMSGNKKFGSGNKKFGDRSPGGKKPGFNKNRNNGDKTNSQSRDFRPIGGGRKFGGKSRR